MLNSASEIAKKIAELREEMRGTLDRTQYPRIRERIMEEAVKLKTLGETD